MTIAEWSPFLVVILSVAGAAGTYAYQKIVDRNSALIEMRRAAYRNYLGAFIAMSDSPERVEDVRRKYYQAEVELLVVGSDQVIQAVGKLSNFYAATNHDRFNRDAAEVRRLVAEICKAMRADCFEESNLSIEEIRAIVPIA
ncbi:hypothetical protein [Rhizobium wuzhouense]|uniref:Uncharacterized protein n=1 Tax=Rhizobium wuzhouense TaxID=1986026 RepID=A0ABX5NY98_9HYPH|nr:hypothetical protein [Rhizobium wuzhouense]PYB77856.1 hypothetical protein DMY87_05835 [Rhizobium wuzhouense]